MVSNMSRTSRCSSSVSNAATGCAMRSNLGSPILRISRTVMTRLSPPRLQRTQGGVWVRESGELSMRLISPGERPGGTGTILPATPPPARGPAPGRGPPPGRGPTPGRGATPAMGIARAGSVVARTAIVGIVRAANSSRRRRRCRRSAGRRPGPDPHSTGRNTRRSPPGRRRSRQAGPPPPNARQVPSRRILFMMDSWSAPLLFMFNVRL